jgi:hypothetical protein
VWSSAIQLERKKTKMPSVQGPVSPEDILQTHPDILSTYNSKPIVNDVIPCAPPLAPGANQPLSVIGSAGSTGTDSDRNRKIVGQVPNGPAFANPA